LFYGKAETRVIKPRKEGRLSWDLNRALALLNEGRTCREIAEILGVKREQVYDAFRARRIEIVRDRRGSKPSWDMDRARELAKQGYAICEIAEIMGLRQELVRSGFKNRGWRALRTKSGRKVTWDVEKARALRAQGRRWVDIDRELGVSPGTVRHHFVRHRLHNPRRQPNMQWDLDEARRLRDKGLSWREVGELVGTDGNNVRRAFLRRGWPVHPQPGD
jgi:DNA-binding CsgD family transcriptional regulator